MSTPPEERHSRRACFSGGNKSVGPSEEATGPPEESGRPPEKRPTAWDVPKDRHEKVETNLNN